MFPFFVINIMSKKILEKFMEHKNGYDFAK